MKQKLKIGDEIRKGDIILIMHGREKGKRNKEKLIVESKVSKQLEYADRIPVNVKGYNSWNIFDLFMSGDRLCGWFTIDDYYKLDDKEALAYLI